jgi:hypothetical protein
MNKYEEVKEYVLRFFGIELTDTQIKEFFQQPGFEEGVRDWEYNGDQETDLLFTFCQKLGLKCDVIIPGPGAYPGPGSRHFNAEQRKFFNEKAIAAGYAVIQPVNLKNHENLSVYLK